MNRSLYFALILAVSTFSAEAEDSNIVIDSYNLSYEIKARQNMPVSVKSREETVYKALRGDDNVIAMTWYNDFVTIDKASAPGAKPVFGQLIPDNIFYDDARICLMKVEVKKDKPAKAVFETTYTRPEHFCDVRLTAPYPARSINVSITIPAELVDRYTITPVDTPDTMHSDRTVDSRGNVTYTYALSDCRPFAVDNVSPAPSISAPRLQITGYFRDLNELSDYFSRLLPAEESSDPQITSTATQICSGLTNDLDKAYAITSWVRKNIRYVAIEHGEYGTRPENASTVLANRYGDCKGSANLIRNLLRSQNIDSRLVWIGTRDDINLKWDETPSLACGNHMIAAAVVNDSTIFLDGTARHCPPAYIPPSIQGQQALVQTDGHCYSTTIVPSTAIETETDSVMSVWTINGSTLTGMVEHRMRGIHSLAYKSAHNGTVGKKQTDLAHRILSFPRKGATVTDINVYGTAPDDLLTVISGHVTEAGAVSNSSTAISVDLKPIRDFLAPQVKANNRRQSVEISDSYRFVNTISLDIPEGTTPVIPADFNASNQWFDASVSYIVDGSTVRCSSILTVRRAIISPEDLTRWDKAIKELNGKTSTRIKFQKI